MDVGDRSSCCPLAKSETPFADGLDEVKLVGAMDFVEASADDDDGGADWPRPKLPLLDVFSDSAETNDFSLPDGGDASRVLLPITRAGMSG